MVGVQPDLVAVDDSLLFEFSDPFEHRRWGHGHLPGHLDIGDPGLFLENLEDVQVDLVHCSPSFGMILNNIR